MMNKYNVKSCYIYDMIKLFNIKTKKDKDDEDFFPIKFKYPLLSFLQLRLTPILTFKTYADFDLKIDEKSATFKSTFDYGIEASLEVNIEAGIYFETKVFVYFIDL